MRSESRVDQIWQSTILDDTLSEMEVSRMAGTDIVGFLAGTAGLNVGKAVTETVGGVAGRAVDIRSQPTREGRRGCSMAPTPSTASRTPSG
jgi:hypothetical protein